MKDIGNQLREAREKRKLSIQDVAIATKINNKVLKAIEDGDLGSLPAKPFLRGFVQSYARYLELNVDDIMKRFLEIQGSTKPKPLIVPDGSGGSPISHEEVQNKFELYKKFAYVGAALVAIIVIYFIQKTVSRYEQESKVAKEQQEVVKAQVVTTDTPAAPPVEGPSVPGDTAEVAPTEVKTEVKAEEKKVEEKIVEVKKVEEKKPEEIKPVIQTAPLITAPVVPIKPEVKAEVKVEPKKVEEKKPEEEKKVEEKKPTSKPQQIIVEALDNVEIRYIKDGEGEKTVKLKPEQFLTIKADSKINLNVSDSGAVNIIHNGRDKGVPGNLGQPTKISYP